ncbi:MAG: hypothetical protein M1839_008086 [Geoglossum umbratile]|nr:MAG: hypothetical protein M1839_008086 [Geoglossum umbratile]
MSSTISQGTTGDLSILRPQDPTQIDISRVAGARQAILGAPRGNLTPETHDKFQLSILGVLELSPNPGATADWIIKKLTPDSGGPEELLAKLYADIYSACRAAKSSGAGRPPKGSGVATPEPSTPTEGDDTSEIDSCHIIAFSTHNAPNSRLETYIDLVKAMFGEAAWLALLRNVVGGPSDCGRHNINRLDNGISMTPSCHRAWDTMAFVLAVDWSTYDSGTGEFDAKFEWITAPQYAIQNFWNGPILTLPSGDPLFAPMASGATIPFRRIIPPLLLNGRQLDAPPIPSAHMLYVRETLARIAHLVGAAGEWEDDDEEESEISDSGL